MEIKTFRPTYLYIKQHKITGKLYFGKTTGNVEKYPGSGTHWTRHISYHGKQHVETLWYSLFYDEDSIREFASLCSTQWNIVESTDWLNKIEEDGVGRNYTLPETREKLRLASIGNTYRLGKKHTEEANEKNRLAHLGRKASEETKIKMSLSQQDRVMSEEARIKISTTLTGVKHTEERVKKNSESHKGLSSPMKGRKHTEEAIEKNRQSKLGQPSAMKGKKHSEEANEKNRLAHLGKKHSEEARIKISVGLIGREVNDDTRAKIGAANKGKIRTPEMRARNSANRKGKGTGKREVTTCPHCSKTGGVGGLKRYHFDNCKQKVTA